MPFGGESFPDHNPLKFNHLLLKKSPMPFGGESFPDLIYDEDIATRLAPSPMPFGGESFPDGHGSRILASPKEGHQCLSAGSPFRTIGIF